MIVILLGFSILLGILFHDFIFVNMIKPVALAFWTFRRVLLSVNQKIYWGLLIFIALIMVYFRLPKPSIEEELDVPTNPNATMREINSWRMSISLTSNEIEKFNSLKQDLGWMLASLLASNQPEKAQWKIYDAMKGRQIPLPQPVYDFLFPDESFIDKRSFKQFLLTIRKIPGTLVRRWTGRELAEYYQSIETVLTFMESLKETNHGDRHFDTSIHRAGG